MGNKPLKKESSPEQPKPAEFNPPPRADGKSQGAQVASPDPKVRPSKAGAVNHEAFIVDNTGKLHAFYDVDKAKLGEGSYGTVSKATSKNTGQIRAVKTVGKTQVKDVAKFKREIAIMKKMDHPFIIKLYETFEDHKNIYLVLELCTGGELFDRIIDAGHFTEKQAALLMMQTLSAINYMHQINICHRDIKPENFLFATKDPIEKSTLKIIDFGLSCVFVPGEVMRTKAGTPYYVAPQVLEGKYDHACDIWSCGVIMFVVLCGYPPFYGETDNQVLQEVRKAELHFDPSDWQAISDDAKNLIRNLLRKNVKEIPAVKATDKSPMVPAVPARYTADRALDDVWIKERAPRSTGAPISAKLVDNLRGFRGQNKLKKAALHVIAQQLDDNQIKALRETFMTLDANGDGLLTSKEMKEGLQNAGFKEIPADLQAIMEQVDSDGSGMIDYTEFLAATMDRKTYLQEDVCWAAFRVFDRNGDGKISKEELKMVLGDDDLASGMGKTAQDLQALMAEVDTDGDGHIDFKEFMAMMRGSKPAL